MNTIKLTVEGKSKYGVLFGGSWYNMAKHATCSLDDFRKGETYAVDFTVDGKGRKEIHKLSTGVVTPNLDSGSPFPPPSAAVANVRLNPPLITQHDRIIARQAVMKSVLESPSLATYAAMRTEDELLSTVKKIAEFAEEWVFRGL